MLGVGYSLALLPKLLFSQRQRDHRGIYFCVFRLPAVLSAVAFLSAVALAEVEAKAEALAKVGWFCGSELFSTHNSLYLQLIYTCHPPSRSTSIQTPFANFSQNHAEARLREGAGSLFDGHAPKQSAARERVKHRIFKCRMWIYDT